MEDYIIYIDKDKSGLGFDPFTQKFNATKNIALSLVTYMSWLFTNHRFALQEFGKSGWVYKQER